MTTLPAKLKMAGYATYMVGKWHLGFYKKEFLPVNQGFDTSSGFLGGSEDHMDERISCGIDFWKDNHTDSRHGTYDSYIYREDLTNIFAKHNSSNPMFLYLPLHNVHAPFQAPRRWLESYSERLTCSSRRTYQAMVSVADNVTGHVVELLKANNMWDNTIFVVSADNGGAPCMGSNYPLKGCKGTYFEEGVRSLAFVNGGLLPDKMRGNTSESFIHIADWYTTFCKLAGVDPSDSGPRKFPVDGLDVWPIVTGENTTAPHKEIVLGFNFTKGEIGAIIVGDYKLIVNKMATHCDALMWSPLHYPCQDGPKGENCDPYCLYNIVDDPSEHDELSSKEPDMLQKLLERYNSYAKEPRDLQDQGYHDPDEIPVFEGVCSYIKNHGGYWQPWK